MGVSGGLKEVEDEDVNEGEAGEGEKMRLRNVVEEGDGGEGGEGEEGGGEAGDDEAADDAKPGSNGGGAISPSVANANAQWPVQAAPDTTSNMAAQADSVLRQASPQPEQPAMAVPASTRSGISLLLRQLLANCPGPMAITITPSLLERHSTLR